MFRTARCLLLLAAAPALLRASDQPADWKSEMERGRKAIMGRDYAGAEAIYRAALARAEAADAGSVVEALRGCAEASRLQGRTADAEELLTRAIAAAERQYGDTSLPVAGLLSELAAAQRSRAARKEALASLERSIRIRDAHPDTGREDLAKDVTAAALLEVALKDAKAKDALERALVLWEAAAPPHSAQLLPVLDALGAIHRDHAEYAEAEAVLLRALAIRESILGPDSSELLATLDSLAYVHFGQKKFADAEPVYRRLLALWETSAGPEHPMVALTLDKMAEFYAFQQRYGEAEEAAVRALGIRTNAEVASLNQTGRILLMQAKLTEAEDLYRRAIGAGDLVKAQNEALDPLLRVYGKVLRALERPKEAEAVEKRAKEALLQKADREGRRPSPVKLQ
jgi:tetratricopeptide (TPR) repeat protein